MPNPNITFSSLYGRYVHVLDGRTGATATTQHKVTSTLFKATSAFPFRTRGRLMAPILMVRLHDNLPQQHLVVLSFDGFLYAIDGMTGCATRPCTGDASYENRNGRQEMEIERGANRLFPRCKCRSRCGH